MSGCAKETCVRDEADALKELLAGVETRFIEEHAVHIDAITERTQATNAQTSLLEALSGEVKAMKEIVDVLCSHTGRLVNNEGDVAAMTNSLQGVANRTDSVSAFVTRLNERIDDIRLDVEHKASEIRKDERQ